MGKLAETPTRICPRCGSQSVLNDDGEPYCLLCGSITPTLSSAERESLRRKHAQLAHRQADAPWAKEEVTS